MIKTVREKIEDCLTKHLNISYNFGSRNINNAYTIPKYIWDKLINELEEIKDNE